MFGQMRKIFGVPDDDQTAAGRAASRHHDLDERVMYLPESKLTPEAVAGAVSADGDCWAPFRICTATGERWFMRISGDSTAMGQGDSTATEKPASIMGFDLGSELPADNFDDGCDSTEDIVESFRQETAIIKSRYSRGEITGTDTDDFDDVLASREFSIRMNEHKLRARRDAADGAADDDASDDDTEGGDNDE